MGMKSIFAQSFRHTSAGKPVFRALALCAGALFLAGCGLLSGPDVTPTPTRPMAAVVPTFTSTPVGAAAAQESGGGATVQQVGPAATQPSAPQPTDTPAPTATPVPNVARFTVKTDLTAANVNVRTGPSTAFAIIGTVGRGAQFDISGRNLENTWFAFSFSGQRGWIFAGLLNVENAHLITVAANIPATPVPPTSTPIPPTPVPAPAQVDHCAGIGGDGCKFWLRDRNPADNGGGELKLLIGFVHGWTQRPGPKVHGGYFVELQKDGVQVAGVDHNTRAGTSTIRGAQGPTCTTTTSLFPPASCRVGTCLATTRSGSKTATVSGTARTIPSPCRGTRA